MYNKLVDAFIDAQTSAWRSYSTLAQIEDRALGATVRDRRAIPVPTSAAILAELRHVYNTLVDRIIEKSRRKCATAAAMPAVSRASVCGLAGIDIERSLRDGSIPDFDYLAELLDTQMKEIGEKS